VPAFSLSSRLGGGQARSVLHIFHGLVHLVGRFVGGVLDVLGSLFCCIGNRVSGVFGFFLRFVEGFVCRFASLLEGIGRFLSNNRGAFGGLLVGGLVVAARDQGRGKQGGEQDLHDVLHREFLH